MGEEAGADPAGMAVAAQRHHRHAHPQCLAGGRGAVIGKRIERDARPQVEVERGQAGIDADGLAKRGDRVVEPALALEHKGEIGMGLGPVRLDADDLTTGRDGFIELALRPQRIGEVDVYVGPVVLGGQHLPVTGSACRRRPASWCETPAANSSAMRGGIIAALAAG
jgi:hypothetical protein